MSELFQMAKAVTDSAQSAFKAGYDAGYHAGYMAAMAKAKEIVGDTFETKPRFPHKSQYELG